MIKEVHLHNWKSFGDAVFYIDPLTAVIGTNSSGKSNLLDALVFLKELASGSTIDLIGNNKVLRIGPDWFNHHEEERGFIKVILEIYGNGYEYLLKFAKRENDQNTIGIFEEALYHYPYEEKIKRRVFRISTINNEDDPIDFKKIEFLQDILVVNKSINLAGINPLGKEYHKVTNRLEEILTSIVFVNPITEHMRNYVQISDALKSDTSNIAGVLASFPDKEKLEIENRLSQYMSKIPEKDLVKVTAEKVGKLGKDAMLYCEENWNNQEEPTIIDASTMSDGTLRFLAIVATLLISKEGSLILIEEVDNGLHPSRAEYLIKVLLELGREKKIDIVFTTHNPALLDALGTEMIPFISVVHRNPTTGNSEITLLEDIEQLPKLMASGSIGKLASQGKIEESLRHQTQTK